MVDSLLDTNIIIDLLRGYEPASTWLATTNNLGVSRVVYMEVIQGASDKAKQDSALRFLNRFALLELTQSDFDWATKQLIQFRLSHGLDMTDCLIASTAYRMQITLYTRNLKHFKPIIGDLATKPY